MRRVLLSTLALVLLGMLIPLTCFAQSDAWERVRLIEPGKRVKVVRLDGKSLSGKMQAWSSEEIVILQGKGKVVQVARTDVATVALQAGMSRARKAGWAALIGAGLGFAVFGGACAGSGECDAPPAGVGASGAIFVGGFAAGVAALIPPHKELIYTAKPVSSPATSP
jgi:hypothetical protein